MMPGVLPHHLLQRVRDGLATAGYDRGGVMVALSGGADSVFLLYAMHLLFSGDSGTPVCAVHVHHGLRGAEADRDLEFCRNLCMELDVPFQAVSVDVPANRVPGEGIEEAARRLRYAVLYDALHEPYRYILTAHHRTDQCETIFLHLIRGCGLRGLTGMPAENGRVLRPLLGFSSAELVGALHDAGIVYVNDSSNADPAFRRNFIRHRILPLLREMNPDIEQTLSKMADDLRQDDALLGHLAQECLSRATTVAGLRRSVLASEDPAVSRRVLAIYLRSKNAPSAERVHLYSADALIRSDASHGAVSVPGAVRLMVHRDLVWAEPDESFVSPVPVWLHPGWNPLPWSDGGFYFTYDSADKKLENIRNVYKFVKQVTLSFDTMITDLYVRTCRPGDAYIYDCHTHSLRKMFGGRKMPRSIQRTWPVLCDRAGILWVPAFSPRDGATAQLEDKNCLYAYYCACGGEQ